MVEVKEKCVAGLAAEPNPAELLARDFDGIIQMAGQRCGEEVPGQACFLPDDRVLTRKRRLGASRYPYGFDGFNFWTYSSGTMHCNEGLFSLFLKPTEGGDPGIAFFGGLKGRGQPVPLLAGSPFPGSAAQRNRCQVFDCNAAYYAVEAGGIRYGVRVFVDRDNAICFSLSASNRSGSPQTCFLSSYLNPFMRHQIYESDEDRWFKQVEVLPKADLPPFLVRVNEDADRFHSITNYGVARRGFSGSAGARLAGSEETTSRDRYVGASKTLHWPMGLAGESFGEPQHLTTFVATAIAADRIDLELESGACARVDLVFRCTCDKTLALKFAEAPADSEAIDRALDRIRQEDARRQAAMDWRISGGHSWLRPETFNRFSRHLKKQVEFCSLIKGYVQLAENSLIGIRDVFQALEALAFWQPGAARGKMLEALGYTAPGGRCFRQYSCPSASGETGRMDLRPFIDQGAWVVSAVATYLKVSGDWNFLQTECGYHEIIDERAGTVVPSEICDSVLEHLFKILGYMLGHRDPETGCVLALYGDWNDSLDGLGISNDPAREFGTGVSVMATLQVFGNLHEMMEILGQLDAARFSDRISAYRQAAREIANALEKHAVVASPECRDECRILHGWGDRRSYFVASFNDPDGVARDGLASNAFWVLSGLWEKEGDSEKRAFMKKTILEAFDRLDSKYGLKTFHPAFLPRTEGVGRIGKLPPGTAENGAAYLHATLFGIQALFRLGEPERAWEQLRKVLPFTGLHQNLTHSPFVIPNSYGWNPAKGIDGQSMNDWQTGSSNVLMKVLVRDVFGFDPGFGNAWLKPASFLPFDRFAFEIDWQGCRLRVEYENLGRGERRFELDGKGVSGEFDPILETRKLLLARADLGRSSLVRVLDGK